MNSEYREAALNRLKKDEASVSGQKEKAMAKAVREALEEFCRQDEEFAQAVVQGGSFHDCMKEVAKGVGQSISDLEAYRRAVQYYFPGAEIRVSMTIDLVGAAAEENYTPKHAAEGPAPGIMLDFTSFL